MKLWPVISQGVFKICYGWPEYVNRGTWFRGGRLPRDCGNANGADL